MPSTAAAIAASQDADLTDGHLLAAVRAVAGIAAPPTSGEFLHTGGA